MDVGYFSKLIFDKEEREKFIKEYEEYENACKEN